MAPDGPKSLRDPFSNENRERRFTNVPSSAAVENDDPIVSVRGKPQPARILPHHQEELRQAKFDFQAKYRTEISETKLLELFFGKCFQPWIREELGLEPEPKPKREKKS